MAALVVSPRMGSVVMRSTLGEYVESEVAPSVGPFIVLLGLNRHESDATPV